MFSLIAIVCQGSLCATFAPPVVYSSKEECLHYSRVLYNVVKDDPDKSLRDITCYDWQDKA